MAIWSLRGSVGSSIVAYMSGITGVNSFPPHFPKLPQPEWCKYTTFWTFPKATAAAPVAGRCLPKVRRKVPRRHGFNIP